MDQSDVTELMERIQRETNRRPAADGAPPLAAPPRLKPDDLPEPGAALPEPPAFPPAAGADWPPLDPVPLAEAATMIPRAREKEATNPRLPGLLRRLSRNQGGFNGILLGASGRLVEAGQDLFDENRRLHERINALSGHAAAQSAWIETLDHARAQDRAWMAAAAAHLVRVQAEADFQRLRSDRMEARLDHLETSRDEHATAFAELEQQRDQDQLWLQSLQARVNTPGVRQEDLIEAAARTEEQLQILRELTGGHAGHLQALQGWTGEHGADIHRLQERADGHAGHLQELQGRTDGHAGHIQDLQSRSDGQAEHLRGLQSRSDDQAGHIQGAREHAGEHTRHLHTVDTRLDLLGEHLGSLQKQSDEQGEHGRVIHGHMDGLGKHVDTVAGHIAPLGDHLGALQSHVDRTTEHLNNVQDYADQIARHVRGLQSDATLQGAHLNDLQTASDQHGGHLSALQEHTVDHDGHIGALQSRLDTASGQYAQSRDEWLQAAARQALLEENARRLEERQVTDASYLKSQLSFHQRLIERQFAAQQGRSPQPMLALPYSGGADASGEPAGGSGAAPAAAEAAENPDEHEFDALYLAFENIFRGNREVIKERVGYFIPYLEAAHVGSAGSPVLDLGCGRGEWLELLGERGFAASGVDLNRTMVEQCRERGLDAVFANALDHLASLPDASRGAITAFHLIEHLPFRSLVRFLEECRRVLQPGGIAIFETPNPDNILVGASTFYSDFTHQRPLPPNSTKFLVEQVGFAEVSIVPLHPYEDAAKVPGHGEEEDSALRERVNALFYGPQDYALVAVTA